MEIRQDKLIRDIRKEAAYTAAMTGRAQFSERVMQAMSQVPRREFVGPDMRAYALDNGPLPIGYGQTISQPYIVALMSDLLATEARHRVLEVGTGSGYQAAVLAKLVDTVYSTEIIPALSREAVERLAGLGYANVRTRIGDGYEGWAEFAPYDGILVTAAAPHIPPPLVEQLKPGARLVIPVGLPYDRQDLILVEKSATGEVSQRNVLPVAFVPLTRSGDN